MRSPLHVFLNSNRWYSAVSDYCLQIMAWLRLHGSADVILVCQDQGPLIVKSERMGIGRISLPLFPSSVPSMLRSWRGLSTILKNARERDDNLEVVWTFEGREHTLAALHRKVFPSLWRGVRLLRVRGQAAHTRNTFTNRWLYTKATDGVVYVADVVRSRTAFDIDAKRSLVFPYCADFSHGLRPWELGYGAPPNENNSDEYLWMSGAAKVDFTHPVFLVVGRFDPVKGHRDILDAFADMDTAGRIVQLVFIGCSENVKARDLFIHAFHKLGGSKLFRDSRGFVASNCGLKRFFVCDERFDDVSLFMRKAHWGVIPSLGSEVICRVAVEFLQNGTPCIATDVGALKQVLEGSPSKIVPLGDAVAWKRCLESAVSIASDSAFFSFLRTQCKRFGLDKYSWDRYAELMQWVRNLPSL